MATRVMGLALLPALVYLLWPRKRRAAWRLMPLLLVSMPRFVLTDFPVLMAIAAVLQNRPSLRTSVLVGLGAVSAAAGGAFARGVWIA